MIFSVNLSCRAMVYENESRWFAQDGQLTKRICEDTSLSAPDCCACDDAKYKVRETNYTLEDSLA